MNAVSRFLAMVAAVPVVAMFGGIGVLAFQIGQTWEEANTKMLISIVGTSCVGGVVVLALVLGALVGIPLAMRINEGREERRERRQWQDTPASRTLTARQVAPGGWDATEPAGSWRSDGPMAYDLWEEAPGWEETS